MSTIDFHDPSLLWDAPQGLAQRPEGSAPARFPADVIERARRESPGFASRMECATGCRLRVNTDANAISLGVRVIDTPRDFGEFIACSGGRVIGEWREMSFKPGAYHVKLALAGASDMREVSVLFPQNVNLVLTSVELAGDLALPPRQESPRWLAIGDSITQGMNAVSPLSTCVEKASGALAIAAWNLGIGGCRMTVEPFEWALPMHGWKAVTVALGTNDWFGSRPVDEFSASCHAMADAVAKAAPRARLIFITPPVARDEDKKAIPLEEYRTAISKVAAERSSYAVDGRTLLDVTHGHFTLDGVHLTDKGGAAYAEKLLPALRAAL